MNISTLDRTFAPSLGDIGEKITTREYEPWPEEAPVHEPSPEISPEKVPAPDRETVPA